MNEQEIFDYLTHQPRSLTLVEWIMRVLVILVSVVRIRIRIRIRVGALVLTQVDLPPRQETEVAEVGRTPLLHHRLSVILLRSTMNSWVVMVFVRVIDLNFAGWWRCL